MKLDADSSKKSGRPRGVTQFGVLVLLSLGACIMAFAFGSFLAWVLTKLAS